jgi:tRNA A37 methylthiotransferase MiaB
MASPTPAGIRSSRWRPQIHLIPRILFQRATLRLLDEVLLDYDYIFEFSNRPWIPAARLDGHVTEEVKGMRYRRLYMRLLLNRVTRGLQRRVVG